MAITKEKKIKKITVLGNFKFLHISGTESIKEDGSLLVEKEITFSLDPDSNLAERTEYQGLPQSEKTRVDELINLLWTDKLKADFQAFKDEEKFSA